MILNNNTGPQFESGTKLKILNDFTSFENFCIQDALVWYKFDKMGDRKVCRRKENNFRVTLN